MEIFKQTKFDFLGKKWPFIGLSLALTVAGLASLLIKGGPRYGIDFNGGALLDVTFVRRPPAEQIRAALRQRISGEIEVQEVSNTQGVLISTGVRDQQGLQGVRNNMVQALDAAFNAGAGGVDQGQSGKVDLNETTQSGLANALREPAARAGLQLSDEGLSQLASRVLSYRDSHSGLVRSLEELNAVAGLTPQSLAVLKQVVFPGAFHIGRVEIVGPKIGADLRQQAINVVLIALAAMLVYIAFRFEWIYGVAAVIAVFHDTIITIGLFSLFNKQIDLTVIAALLTLVGYSMNDTIVVFDRIRENLKLNMRGSFRDIVNASINQTLSRTVLTSGLTLLTAISLYLFGGQVLNGFSFALVVGIIVGTYSSVFVASPILIFWHDQVEARKRRARAMTGGGPRVMANPKGIKAAK